jgi:CheY-like chemotaxis protein
MSARERGTRRAATVLVIEDDEVSRTIFVMVLRDAGLVVHEAGSRAEGLRLARMTRPSILVLDRKLPDGDGWEVIDELRAIAGLERVSVLAVTAHEPPVALGEVERWFVAGCDAFLAKPCNPEALVHAVQRLLAEPNRTAAARRRRLHGQRNDGI